MGILVEMLELGFNLGSVQAFLSLSSSNFLSVPVPCTTISQVIQAEGKDHP